VDMSTNPHTFSKREFGVDKDYIQMSSDSHAYEAWERECITYQYTKDKCCYYMYQLTPRWSTT
jgi:hypothetical protein